MSTDDDDYDDGASLAVRAEYTADASEPGPDGVSKQQLSYTYSNVPSALQYTRRPSGTNNHSTVPHVHRRMSSNSSPSGHVRGIPRSAPHPSHSSTEDDDAFSDLGLSSRDNADTEESDVPSEKGSDGGRVRLGADKTKRSRNRASLPAYFSLLQISSPRNEPRSSPVSSSSGRTVARASPPTPKLALSSRPAQVVDGHPPASIHATPRGRRRVPCESSSSHRSDSSLSRSHSRAQRPEAEIVSRLVERDSRSRFDGDWSSVPGQPTRGRTTFRRNSSPPPKVLLGMEDRGRTLAAVRQAEIFDRSESRGERRGRARNNELDGLRFSEQAPGFGNGRSGLVGRERDRDRERSLGFVSRVPL